MKIIDEKGVTKKVDKWKPKNVEMSLVFLAINGYKNNMTEIHLNYTKLPPNS